MKLKQFSRVIFAIALVHCLVWSWGRIFNLELVQPYLERENNSLKLVSFSEAKPESFRSSFHLLVRQLHESLRPVVRHNYHTALLRLQALTLAVISLAQLAAAYHRTNLTSGPPDPTKQGILGAFSIAIFFAPPSSSSSSAFSVSL